MSGVLRTVVDVVVMDRKIAQQRASATIICKIFYAIGVIVVGKSPGVAPPQPFRVGAFRLLDFLLLFFGERILQPYFLLLFLLWATEE